MNASVCSVQQVLGKRGLSSSSALVLDSIQTHIYNTIGEIPADAWDSLLQASHYYLNRNYLKALETCAKEDQQFRYILITQKEQPLIAAYCQIIPFDVGKTGNYTQSSTENPGFSFKSFASGIFNRIMSNMEVNLLVCGNVYLSGEYGFAVHPAISEKKAYQYLLEAMQTLIKQDHKKVSAILIKDFYTESEHPVEIFNQDGFHLFHADPIMLMDIPKEWNTFEDYSNLLSSKYRQRLKGAYKKSQHLTTRELSLEDVIALNNQLFPLFENVVRKSSFNLKDTPREYFIALKKHLKEDIKITAYFDKEELVGFMTVIRAGNHLEAHFLGYDENQNHQCKMYMRMLYDMIKTGIEENFSRISFGRTAMEIKTTVGAVPNPANLYLKLTNPVFNFLGGPVIRNIRQEVFVPRHPFKGQEELEGKQAEKDNPGS